MSSRRLLSILLASLGGCGGAEAPPADEGLSVLFLNVELLRADFVGLLNPESDATPNIDRFFRDAVIFEDVSAPAGETARSSCAVQSALEGLYFAIDPDEAQDSGYVTGLKMYKLRHADRIVGIAETLTENGFATVNVNQGRRSGRHVGFDVGFRHYAEFHHRGLIDESLDALLEELHRVREERSFTLFHPNTLHASPYRYPVDRERVEAQAIQYVQEGDGYDVRLAEGELGEEQKRTLARAVYRQQVRYVDDALARVFEHLEEHHVDDTIIVLYANHGEGLHDNGVAFHGVSYQSCIHVPLLIRHPRISGPLRIETPISLVDLVPTIFDWLGIEVKHYQSGTSLVPLIEDGEYERDAIFGKSLFTSFVRQGEWKLITGQRDELYDLEADPHEENDLIGEHPDVADRLRVILMAKEREAAAFRSRR